MAQRRRKFRAPHPGRLLTFGPVLALPAWGWASTAPLVHWEVAGLLFLASLLLWPPLVVLVLFGVPCLPSLLVPRKWRIAHRKRHAAETCCYGRLRCRVVHRGRHGRGACRSSYIPEFLKRLVYAADRDKCLYCGNAGECQVDHFIPWAGGGRGTFLNLSLLCQGDNLIKLNYSVDRDGYIHYHGYQGLRVGQSLPRVVQDAAEITRVIRPRRLRPLRLVRVAWALG